MEVTAVVLAQDGGSFVLMRQPRWKEVGRIKIFRQKGP